MSQRESPTPTGNNPHPLPLDTRELLNILGKRPVCLLASSLPLKDDEHSRHQRGIHMKRQIGVRALLGSAMALTMWAAAGAAFAGGQTPLAIDSARITISGTSNIHAYTASTTTVRVTRAQVAGVPEGPDFWANVLKPGCLEAFEVAIPAATLTSPREGVDKNMHDALQVKGHPDIVFRLLRLEPRSEAAGALRGVGVLQIAGVDREVNLDITTERQNSTLTVRGRVQFLMTDFGIKPPTAMLGMLKTDPKVTVTFETVLTIPRT
jgi:polyisoprenoid-binding protein YceI